jgi:DNA-binding MarR family transcriptional regulator
MNEQDNQSKVAARLMEHTTLKVLPPVTSKQGKCLEFILKFFVENRYYPTQREVATAMGIQSNTAEMYIQPLVAKGYLTREPGKQRNIRLQPEALERLELMGVNVQDRLVTP